MILLTVEIISAQSASSFRPDIPLTWDESALKDWATPLAGLNAPPTHIPPAQYYSLPVDNLKTYPVYQAGKEPAGYWEFLNKIGPRPMIEAGTLKSEADWIEAGRTVFEEMDLIHLRTYDPKFVEVARRGPAGIARRDGTVANLRWVPTNEGVALTFANCASCHVARLKDGTEIPGGPLFAFPPPRTGSQGPGLIGQVERAKGYVNGASPIRGIGAVQMWLFQAFQVPWQTDDPHTELRTMTEAEHDKWFRAVTRGGALPRWNGSIYYPAKIPDLIGIKDRKYIDHTATHLNRGIGDLMRYAALVSWAETTDFGSYHMVGGKVERPAARRSDEALYALALYLQSLRPPPNPNPADDTAKAGAMVFEREGCSGCHTPPLYTNNRLTLAEGFKPPANLPSSLDVMRVSVRTDPSLALKTRKGTGFYKVPSLKGLWYRGHYLHDGSAASLEEMFDPDRLSETHRPGGFTPPGRPERAIQGHEFGLRLSLEERKQLIAFLRTL